MMFSVLLVSFLFTHLFSINIFLWFITVQRIQVIELHRHCSLGRGAAPKVPVQPWEA
ncbi:hypothetical protein SLEP1_g12356 [Rubroshorea leprosula]|uniref:Uncharacterized protein n=1 Tax=Rubroshorea leprosula TaxID=152421 RepID=A0AAV5II55_9ROSI|nr:hypothetical protein SLEP1_g12356 [Rubroshorea leprosula]